MALLDVLGTAAAVGRSLLQATRAVDVVGITGAGYLPMFSEARPLVANVYEDAQLMEHPIENGSVIADHIVFQPIEIELPMICVGELAYRSTYAAIKTTFKAGALLTVTTRTGSYSNMVITEMPHEETGDMFDAVAITVRLREAVVVTPQSAAVPQSSGASTTPRGTQQTTATNATDTSAATNSYDNSGAVKPGGSTLYNWAYGDS